MRFGAQAPAPASIAVRREADSLPAAAGQSHPEASETRRAWLTRTDEQWQPRRWSAAPAAAAPLAARSRTPSPQPFRPAAPAARPGSSAAAQLQSAEADSSAPECETPLWLSSQTLMRPVARTLDWSSCDDGAGSRWVFKAEAAEAAASIQTALLWTAAGSRDAEASSQLIQLG